ncbi:MAG: GAF domain-containing protein [Acidobacteria bacterium]|nr:GAF domain-containing protein [Acidobacteriota bacterium]
MSAPGMSAVHPVTGRRPVPVLRILYPSGREEMVPLSKTPFRIGPAEDCDLRLANGHQVEGAALIQHGPGGYLVRDLQGEVLRWNGKPVRSRVLRHGDSFEFGSPSLCQISFLLPAPGNPARDLQNLKMLIEITRSVNSFCELDDLLQKILAGALQVTGAERGMVLLAGPGGDLLLTASRDREGPAPGGPDSRPSWSIANEVFRRGRSISVRDAQTHQDFRDRTSIMALGLNTILCVPMQIQERTLGVIYLDHRGVVENLALTDFQVVESLAATAAIAIENVRLVEAKVHSERLSAVGQMASSLVHDMRGPMTTLQGYAELLRGHPALDEKGRRYVDRIRREVQRIGTMATDVLEYARGKTTLHRAATTVGEVIDDILPLVEANLEPAGITLDLDLERDLRITVDPVKIGRALLNLATNAIHATPRGGRLRIAARSAPPEVRFEVEDTGRGIPDGIRDKIWEPFFSHGEEQGSGLGLAIVRRVVEQHGGRIELQSEVGRGTTVRIFLSLAPAGV